MLINDPWPHMVIDDYIDQPVLDGVLEVAHKKIKEGKTGAWRLEDERPDLYPAWEKKVKKDYFEFYLQFPEKRFIITPKVLSHIVVLPPGYTHPIHHDRFQKIFTSITYVYPNKGTGTYLHETNNSPIYKEINWQTNRTFLFAAVSGKSWHSYENATNEPRVTFANMLVDKYVISAYNFYRKYVLQSEDRLCL
jgi:hypothetical protein